MPTSVEEIAPYFDTSVNPEMQVNPLNGSSLDRETKHSILQRVLESEWFEKTLTRGAVPQGDNSSRMQISGSAATVARPPTVSESLAAFNQALTQFQHRNGGQRPATEAQLEPFLSAPMNTALLRMLFEASRRPSAAK